MRPKRTSVAWCADGARRIFLAAMMVGIITRRPLFVVCCSLRTQESRRSVPTPAQCADSYRRPSLIALMLPLK